MLILPLRAFIFQTLLLLTSIAIEATIIHRQLNLSRLNSIQYATTLNLFSTVLGWLVFFITQSMISEAWRTQLISYILFTHLIWGGNGHSILIGLGTLGVIAFILSVLFEMQVLNVLKLLLAIQPEPINRHSKMYRYRRSMLRREQRDDNQELKVLLIANAYSYSAVLVLLTLILKENNILGYSQ